MNNKELKELVRDFEINGKDSSELNAIRSAIFDSYDSGDINSSSKDSLLKELYSYASNKGIFFLRVTERTTRDLPKTNEEEETSYEDESYEESYEESYDDEDYEDD